MEEDYYTILGVGREASHQQIRAAYRKLVVQYHPDRNPTPLAAQRICDINVAYDVLGDAERRRAYDQRYFYAMVAVADAAPAKPAYTHPRDPYRGPRPHTGPRGPSAQTLLLQKMQPYVLKICYLSLALVASLLLDLMLPPHVRKDNVVAVRVYDRYEAVSVTLVTQTRRVLELTNPPAALRRKGLIYFQQSAIWNTEMRVTDATGKARMLMAYIYRHLVFFPILLLLSALAALRFRQNLQFSMNAGIVSTFLLILTFSLMFLL